MSITKTTTSVDTLKINYLTQEMYEDALENNEINANEIYLTLTEDNPSLFPIHIEAQSGLGDDRYLVNVTEEEIWQAYEDGKILVLIDDGAGFVVTDYRVEHENSESIGNSYCYYDTIWFNYINAVWDPDADDVEITGSFLYGINFNNYDDSNYDLLMTSGRLVYKETTLPQGFKSTTVSLGTSGWSSNSKTVNVTGISSSSDVIVSPAPASYDDYTSAGIYCSAQGSDTLTFTCTTTPSNAITVNILYR